MARKRFHSDVDSDSVSIAPTAGSTGRFTDSFSSLPLIINEIVDEEVGPKLTTPGDKLFNDWMTL